MILLRFHLRYTFTDSLPVYIELLGAKASFLPPRTPPPSCTKSLPRLHFSYHNSTYISSSLVVRDLFVGTVPPSYLYSSTLPQIRKPYTRSQSKNNLFRYYIRLLSLLHPSPLVGSRRGHDACCTLHNTTVCCWLISGSFQFRRVRDLVN
ncbi:hypothetical protein CPB83DRAFT_697162 [Crepidotus variabilis]|uniref:Uncharacterized protein n=1 Tax=Crepidotus variabilis TaxID=179855 RepID=A0A9P6JJY2_9AGAR|nr:hypothetical protein CPB83DRAFT_697162 [Crepidotus variabilis]